MSVYARKSKVLTIGRYKDSLFRLVQAVEQAGCLFHKSLTGRMPVPQIINRPLSLFHKSLTGRMPVPQIINRPLSLFHKSLTGRMPVSQVINRQDACSTNKTHSSLFQFP
jgi:hypothetical protein